MSINPLNDHYSMENPATVFDEESLTVLQLVGRTAAKVNEIVDDHNRLREENAAFDDAIEAVIEEQDAEIERVKTVVVPSEVEKQIDAHVAGGSFDRAISEYANGLEQRLDNIMQNIPEGGTQLDAEVIDIRVAENGVTHATAGASVRKQIRDNAELTRELHANNGVYAIPLNWANSENASYFYTTPFPIPAAGMSARVVNFGPFDYNGKSAKLMARTKFGHMVDGDFVEDDELNTTYTNGKYTNMTHFVPHMAGVFARVDLALIANNSNVMVNGDVVRFAHLKQFLKVYTGTIQNGGNVIGNCTASLLNGTSLSADEAEQKWNAQWSPSNWVFKNTAMTTPLPLEHVGRVSCAADAWIGAKVYKFDPVTRSDEWVETIAFNEQHPCFGNECVIDFTKYGKNYYAIIAYGRVPYFYEYKSTGYNGGTTGTSNVSNLGIAPDIVNKIHVEWLNGEPVRSAPVLSATLQKNLELLKLPHKIVAGMNPKAENQYRYSLPQNDFAGTFYAGSYTRGTLFYHVSPATYFAALLNPNSCAYGDSNVDEDGGKYGTVCASFCSLLHGYPIPLSVFDFRDNKTVPWFKTERINLRTDAHKLKGGDLLTDESGGTGHTVMVTGVTSVDNSYSGINVLESVSPATRENVFMLHNAPRFYKGNAENAIPNEYVYVQYTDPAYDNTLWDKANWKPHYTDPQRVMCSRGYGGVYIKGVNQVNLSVAMDVTQIDITLNGNAIGSYVPEDLSAAEKNGYRIVNIAHLVDVGTVRVRNNVDDSVEEFHIVSADDYTVDATLTEDELRIVTNRPEKVKIVNVHYRYIDGDFAGQTPNMEFMPDFNGGVMILPNKIETDCGTLTLTAHASNGVDYKDLVNLVFVTDYDTNTFGVDAQGDAFN